MVLVEGGDFNNSLDRAPHSCLFDDWILEFDDIESIKWLAEVTPNALLVPCYYARYRSKQCTMLEYFILSHNSQACAYISQLLHYCMHMFAICIHTCIRLKGIPVHFGPVYHT